MARRRKGRPINGILLVDKPKGMSSNGLLQKVKWLYQAQKAGHTGALDPAATGLLPICFGEATKFTQFLLDANKRYTTTGVFGIETDTLDAEGEIIAQADVPDISERALNDLLASEFTGAIEQVPPMYSALKRDGKKLYELAREGKTIELEARPVSIFNNQLLALNSPEFTLDVRCSKGTYIRTLVADIGHKFGCGAHVKALHRTEHGKFAVEYAKSLDSLIAMQERGDIEAMDELLIPIDVLLSELPKIQLDEKYTRLFSNGNDVNCAELPGKVRVYGVADEFLGVGRVSEKARLHPERLIAR